MKEFLMNYWKEILEAVVLVASILICCIKKKPVLNEMDNILLKVLEKLPEWISNAESLKGADVKKSIVLETAKKYVQSQFNITLSDEYISFIGSRIEDILSTPQKK